MTHIRKKAIEGLNVGDIFSISREFTEKDVNLFADITRDYNPVHFDERFIKAKGLNRGICHGLLVASMITEIGGQMGCLATDMSFSFKKPVYFGDRIVCNLVISEKDDNGWFNAKAEYKNQNGTIVIEALLRGIAPDLKEKEVMKAMIAEGENDMPEMSSRQDLLNTIEKEAHDYERDFHGCSRCVLKPLQDHLDLGDDESFKASTPMAAGVAMRGETCGALIGGLMAVGLAFASENMDDADALINALAAGFRLARKVEKAFGTTNCTKIQTDQLGRFYSLADPKQYQAFIEAGGYVKCSKICGKIARMTAEFILEQRDKETR